MPPKFGLTLALTGASQFLHLVHAVIASVVFIITVLTVLAGVGSIAFRTPRLKEDIATKIKNTLFLERVYDLSSVVSAVIHKAIAHMTISASDFVYERLELGILDRFNHIVAEVISDVCVKLESKLDIVGDYYAAIIWFVGGALLSIALLFLL